MSNPSPFPPIISPDTVAETDEEIMREIIHAVSCLNEEDCNRVVMLQKYHESLYLYGFGVPQYRHPGTPVQQWKH